MKPTVLIAGGSGYLGQFLVDRFSRDGWNVVYTYNSSVPLPFAANPTACKVDFVTGDGLDACFSLFERGDDDHHCRLNAVINCVAISQPVACENDPEKARLINIPTKLLDQLKKYQQNQEIKAKTKTLSSSKDQQPPPPPLVIFLSTDQVYDGSKSFWKETDVANPINQYGKSKIEAERVIQEQWPHHIILRSSLIFGPEPPAASVGRSLFLQFVDAKLASGEATSFFSDEWRSAVYVQDIITVCKLLIEASLVTPREEETQEVEDGDGRRFKILGVLNMGGPERLSRVDMAQKVATVRHHDPKYILEVPSASVSRGVASPSDISMDSTILENAASAVASEINLSPSGFRFTKFIDALHEIFNDT